MQRSALAVPSVQHVSRTSIRPAVRVLVSKLPARVNHYCSADIVSWHQPWCSHTTLFTFPHSIEHRMPLLFTHRKRLMTPQWQVFSCVQAGKWLSAKPWLRFSECLSASLWAQEIPSSRLATTSGVECTVEVWICFRDVRASRDESRSNELELSGGAARPHTRSVHCAHSFRGGQ